MIARLDGEGFRPTLIMFPSTTPTLDADVVAMAELKARYGAPLFCFGPHASCTPEASMARAPMVDGMFIGEPEDGLLALAQLDSLDRAASIPNLTFRRGPEIVAASGPGQLHGVSRRALPGLGVA